MNSLPVPPSPSSNEEITWPRKTRIATTLPGAAHQKATFREDHQDAPEKLWTALRCQSLLNELDALLLTLQRRCAREDGGSRDLSPLKRDIRHQYDDNARRKRPRLTYLQRQPRFKIRPCLLEKAPKRPSANRCDATAAKKRTATCQGLPNGGSKAVQTWFADQDHRDYHGHCSTSLPRNIHEDIQTLRRSNPHGHDRSYKVVLDWLWALLVSTRPKEKDVHPKSLLAMCLRRIPACVEDIENWEKAQAENGAVSTSSLSDIRLDLYQQLENLGRIGLGWQPLKVAVRAHTIWILKRAISEEVFDPMFVRIMVKLCTDNGCVEEGAHLAFSMPGAFPPPRHAQSLFTESTKLQPLEAIITHAAHNGQACGVIFVGISNLIQEKRLPASWIPTRPFFHLLRFATNAIATGKGGSTPLGLLTSATDALLHWTQRQQGIGSTSSAEETILALAAVLATAATHEHNANTNKPQPKQPCHKLLDAIDALISHSKSDGKDWAAGKFSFLYVARFLAASHVESDDGSVNSFRGAALALDLIKGQGTSHGYQQAKQLVHSLIREQGRFVLENTEPGPDNLIHNLVPASPQLSLIEKLMADETEQDGRVSQNKTPRARQNGQFRRNISLLPTANTHEWHWEEGIGEWIVQSEHQERHAIVSSSIVRYASLSAGYGTGHHTNQQAREKSRDIHQSTKRRECPAQETLTSRRSRVRQSRAIHSFQQTAADGSLGKASRPDATRRSRGDNTDCCSSSSVQWKGQKGQCQDQTQTHHAPATKAKVYRLKVELKLDLMDEAHSRPGATRQSRFLMRGSSTPKPGPGKTESRGCRIAQATGYRPEASIGDRRQLVLVRGPGWRENDEDDWLK